MPEKGGARPAASFLEAHQPLVDRLISSLARRKRLETEEAEDFRSWLYAKLLEREMDPLAGFRGECRVETFLANVVHNLFRDYRIAKWGRWRASAKARRLGPVAMKLESLLYRDGFSAREAVKKVLAEPGLRLSEEDLFRLVAQIPPRMPRRFEGERELESLSSSEDPEEDARNSERQRVVDRVRTALAQGLASLPDEDRLILRLRFQEEIQVSRIAALLVIEQKPLYRRIQRLTRMLREHFEAAGVTMEEIREILGWRRLDLEIDFER